LTARCIKCWRSGYARMRGLTIEPEPPCPSKRATPSLVFVMAPSPNADVGVGIEFAVA
jgi:hypothetical protein